MLAPLGFSPIYLAIDGRRIPCFPLGSCSDRTKSQRAKKRCYVFNMLG
jgi:hypothetical protein